jgi:hypothetical protein
MDLNVLIVGAIDKSIHPLLSPLLPRRNMACVAPATANNQSMIHKHTKAAKKTQMV